MSTAWYGMGTAWVRHGYGMGTAWVRHGYGMKATGDSGDLGDGLCDGLAVSLSGVIARSGRVV